MGLIQIAAEKAGIATVSITHLPDLTKKVLPPRALHMKYPLGKSFGAKGDRKLQRKVVLDMLTAIIEMNHHEKIHELPYTNEKKPSFLRFS